VSKFLSLKTDPLRQPAVQDRLEQQTWCSLRIQVGSRFASRLWDKTLEAERDTLDVPAFSIAEWVVQNWWSLFNELCPWNSVPKKPAAKLKWFGWIKRHCFRAADSALLLPKLYVYSDGRDLVAESHPDRPGSLPHMPGEFLSDTLDVIDSQATKVALSHFINQTLSRLDGFSDDRLEQCAAQWNAIANADPEEVEFCRLAGRMGLNPYDGDQMTDYLSSFFEELGSPDRPLVRDLTELAQPEVVKEQWSWVNNATSELQLGPSNTGLPFKLPDRKTTPAEFGYKLARIVRASANVTSDAIESVEGVAEAAVHKKFHVYNRDHLPGTGIKAIVGQIGTGDFVAAGPEVSHPYNQRFMIARSLYHALATSQESERLVTAAYSSDQKASRAFAAELLAPQNALLNRLSGSFADPETVSVLSRDFGASSYVIERQLENAGVELSAD